MKSPFSLELGPPQSDAVCECCGLQSKVAHGFVYQRGDAFAIYYAKCCVQFPERGVAMAVATGVWDEDSVASDRTAIGLEARSTDREIQFAVVSPEQSPWGETPLLGKMLSREAALVHPALPSTFAVAEVVVHEDPRLRAMLGMGE